MLKKKVTKITESDSRHVYSVTGKEAGQETWYIVKVSQLKLPLFLKMLKQKSYDLNQVASIIVSGWGKLPQETIDKYSRQSAAE